MIVRETPPRALSRWGLVAVCLLGAVLLPLLPMRADPLPLSDPAEEFAEEFQDPTTTSQDPINQPPREPASRKGNQPVRTKADFFGAAQDSRIKQQEEELTDEIELLEIQRAAKRAEQEAAVAHLRAAESRAARLEKMAAAGVPEEQIEKALAEVQLARSQVIQKEVALREAEIRIRQAARRLEALSQSAKAAGAGARALFQTQSYDFGTVSGDRPLPWSVTMVNRTKDTYRLSGVRVNDSAVTATPHSVELTPNDQGTIAVWIDPARFSGTKTFQVWVHFSEPREEQVLLELKATRAPSRTGAASSPPKTTSPPKGDEDRLRQLEKRLDRLLEEIEGLRKEMRPKKATGMPVLLDDREVMTMTKRDFPMPFQTDRSTPEGKRITHVTLWHTRDSGQTWEEVQRVVADAGKFDVRGLEDGLHGFAISTMTETGGGTPAPQAGTVPTIRVRVKADE